MENSNYNFISVSQVIKQLDNEYTEEATEELYNSNFIFEY